MKKTIFSLLTVLIALLSFNPVFAEDTIGFYLPPDVPVQLLDTGDPAKEPPAFTFEPPVLDHDTYVPPADERQSEETAPGETAPESAVALLTEEGEKDTPQRDLYR